ncbi:MAG: dTMP kinase [Actinobacteria bacterium]|nr:dTMP kinase [Actinomycetota bacterium]
MPGFFIAFEGGDGAGKSTQVKLLAAALQGKREVVVTREPGGSDVAEHIREVLLNPNHRIDGMTEALLFAAARADHVSKVIRPALEQNRVVICDRFVDSSIAYQGVARNLGIEMVRELNQIATNNLMPDLTIVLDVSTDAGLARAQEPNRMENEGADFHEIVKDAFIELAKQELARYLVVAANQSREAIAEIILQEVSERLK